MTRRCSTCNPSQLTDPTAIFRELEHRGLLRPGPDLLVLVANATSQLVGAAELTTDLEQDYGGEHVASAAEKAGAQRKLSTGPLQTTMHLVRRRTGRTTPLPFDLRGFSSWLNGSNWVDCYAGEWFLITDHGWRSLLSDHGPVGVHPRLSVLQVVAG